MGINLYFVSLLPFVFYIALFTLIIVLIVKLLKKKPDSANQTVVQDIAAESAQLQKESAGQQQFLAEELKEVKARLASIETILKEVE
ncbi:hypothetical protein [Sporosarcina limicola]|uniref:Uncharacterized protein n=1 Tax=Sporosarcina limicola TaxID=34101 RepID=A0A927MKM7_9BACL|nr:hypothetical protein [Sporosarcina limicola]MBE1555636.1 hypothetical protein [Sporosarcina limicola]